MEKEVKHFERNLGIHKDKERLNRFKKQIARENYDDDLLDFLDNITETVKVEKTKKGDKNKQYNEEGDDEGEGVVVPKKKLKKNKQVENKEESLVEIKSKSKLFSGRTISSVDRIKMEFSKEIIPLLNKAAESNLIIIAGQLIEKIDFFETTIRNDKSCANFNKNLFLYELFSKNCNKLILDQDTINMPIIACICSYISLLHFKLGNPFLLYYLKTIFIKFEEYCKDPMTNKCGLKNFIFAFILFYLFGNLTSKIYFDVIKYFIDNFNDTFSEMLYIMLSYVGIEIRKEDPEYLKEIINLVNSKYNSIKISSKLSLNNPTPTSTTLTPNDNTTSSSAITEVYSSKMKFIVELIDDIKNNKFLKFNMKEKFGFFINFVTQQSKIYNFGSNDTTNIASKLDLTLKQIKSLDINKFEDFEGTTKINDVLFDTDITNIQVNNIYNNLFND